MGAHVQAKACVLAHTQGIVGSDGMSILLSCISGASCSLAPAHVSRHAMRVHARTCACTDACALTGQRGQRRHQHPIFWYHRASVLIGGACICTSASSCVCHECMCRCMHAHMCTRVRAHRRTRRACAHMHAYLRQRYERARMCGHVWYLHACLWKAWGGAVCTHAGAHTASVLTCMHAHRAASAASAAMASGSCRLGSRGHHVHWPNACLAS